MCIEFDADLPGIGFTQWRCQRGRAKKPAIPDAVDCRVGHSVAAKLPLSRARFRTSQPGNHTS